jgi:subtilisin family serine protease
MPNTKKSLFLMAFLCLGMAFFIFSKNAHAATISSISPNVLTPGSTELTITGSGFGAYNSSGDQVCFNYIDAGYSYIGFCTTYGSSDIISWSDTTIVARVPSDSSGAMIGGQIHIYADYTENDGPYYHMQPVVSALSINQAYIGDKIKITGKYLRDALGGAPDTTYYLKVFFNNAGATVLDAWTSSEIDTAVPAGATTGPVTVEMEFADGSAKVTATGPTLEVYMGVTGDPYSSLQSYLQQVRINDTWGLIPQRPGPIVAIIDDGVYINHPDLRNNIWINKKETIGNRVDDDKNGYVDDIYGWNYITNSGEMTTRGTHGTMVAGIIGAVSNNQIGIAGINTNVKLMPLIVCDSKLGCSNAAISKAIRYAADNGAKIINMSLSTWATTGYTTEFNSAIKYAYDKGVIIVVAAGNGDVEGGIGQDLNIIPQSPVCNEGSNFFVVGVGAVDAENYLTTWSNYGTKCVDAYAPGVDIVTTAVPAYSSFGGFYDVGSGTSFAAPIVTGIISLLLQKYPTMPAREVFARLWRNTDNGVINAYKVLSDVYVPKVLGQVAGTPFIATGTKSGGGPEVRLFSASGKMLKSFNAYDEKFRGGINVAIGDVNADGLSEIVTSAREGGVPLVRIFTASGKNLKLDFNAYDANYRGGINLAVADINGDGLAEIITAPMGGMEPKIRIFSDKYGKITRVVGDFLAYDKKFRGGVSVSVGDINGDGKGEIITSPTSKGGPQIRAFVLQNNSYKPLPGSIMAYDPKFRGGVNSTVGDVNGDGKDEIMTGVVGSGGPHIRFFKEANNALSLLSAGFMAFDKSFRGGISLASVDINNDGIDEILAGVGSNGNPTVRIYNQLGKQVLKEFNAYSTSYKNGITLAGGYF